MSTPIDRTIAATRHPPGRRIFDVARVSQLDQAPVPIDAPASLLSFLLSLLLPTPFSDARGRRYASPIPQAPRARLTNPAIVCQTQVASRSSVAKFATLWLDVAKQRTAAAVEQLRRSTRVLDGAARA